MNIKKIFSIVFFSLGLLTASGQATKIDDPVVNQIKKEDLAAIKSRPLIICKIGIAQIDKDIEALVKKIWTFHSEVLFYDNDQIKKKLAEKEAGYSIISFEVVDFLAVGEVPDCANGWVRVSLKLSEKYDKPKAAFSQDVSVGWKDKTLHLEKREIIFALNVIQNHLVARDAGKKGRNEILESQGMLAKRTLLIDEKFVGDKFTLDDLKKSYRFPYKVTNREFIEKAQLEKNKEYAFVVLTPMGASRLLTHLIINCEDGKLLSYGEFYNGFGDSYSNFVSQSHVEAYMKYSDYKAYKQNGKSK